MSHVSQRRVTTLSRHLCTSPPSTAPFKKCLIANRGEIAIRISNACAELGIQSVGIYTPSDHLSLHTRVTTESYEIPEGGYLQVNKIIQAALSTFCDCVHPGYGFLSENESLRSECEKNNLIFVGPSLECLQLFGDKTRARKHEHWQSQCLYPLSQVVLELYQVVWKHSNM